MDNARPNDRVPLELDGQSLQEGVALQRVDRAQAARMALYPSSERLSGMGVLERGQAPGP